MVGVTSRCNPINGSVTGVGVAPPTAHALVQLCCHTRSTYLHDVVYLLESYILEPSNRNSTTYTGYITW